MMSCDAWALIDPSWWSNTPVDKGLKLLALKPQNPMEVVASCACCAYTAICRQAT